VIGVKFIRTKSLESILCGCGETMRFWAIFISVAAVIKVTFMDHTSAAFGPSSLSHLHLLRHLCRRWLLLLMTVIRPRAFFMTTSIAMKNVANVRQSMMEISLHC
jgi:hypothetical protein